MAIDHQIAHESLERNDGFEYPSPRSLPLDHGTAIQDVRRGSAVCVDSAIRHPTPTKSSSAPASTERVGVSLITERPDRPVMSDAPAPPLIGRSAATGALIAPHPLPVSDDLSQSAGPNAIREPGIFRKSVPVIADQSPVAHHLRLVTHAAGSATIGSRAGDPRKDCQQSFAGQEPTHFQGERPGRPMESLRLESSRDP